MHRSDDDEPIERSDRLDEPRRSGPGRARGVLAGLAIVALVVFAAVNFRPVRVNFVLFSSEARVVTVIVVAAALGFVVGYFVGRPTREQRRRLRDLGERDGRD